MPSDTRGQVGGVASGIQQSSHPQFHSLTSPSPTSTPTSSPHTQTPHLSFPTWTKGGFHKAARDSFALFSLQSPETTDDALFAPLELVVGMGGTRGPVGGSDSDSGGMQGKGGRAAGLSSSECPPPSDRSLRVRAFIDCGASHGIVSQAFVTLHNIRALPDSSLGSCLLGDGSAQVRHVGRTELMTVRCGDTAFTYSFHILQQAVHDVILGRDIMHLCGMEVVGIPAVFPSDQDADGPRREAEHTLREPKRRLTTDDPSPFAALSKYPEALAMCEAAVARNVAARAASGGAATTLPNSQLRVRHAADTPPSYTPPYPIKHTDKAFVEGEIEEWLMWYQIEHVPHSSHSPYNTPLLVAYTYASDGSIKKRRLIVWGL